MLEFFSYTFIQHACLAALLASIACGIIGTLVVVNRMVFLAGGVAHSAYGGIGLAIHFGLPVLPCTIAFSVAASLAMAHLSFTRANRADAAIGVLWAAGMAFGIILLDMTPGYRSDIMSFLFGSILTVSTDDLLLMLAIDIILLGIIACCHQTLLVTSFDQDFAAARGIPVHTVYLLMVAMAALGIVTLIRVVGLILVMALLTIPPFIALRSTRALPGMMLEAFAWSLTFCLKGLWVSYYFNITSGAAIIAAAIVGFGLVAIWHRYIKPYWKRRRVHAQPSYENL